MKLSSFFTQTSTKLDAFTLGHLAQWCERYRPTSEEPDVVLARMVAFLESLEDWERKHYLNGEWTRVFDAMEAAR
jgi:hypothetical protein